MDWRAQCFGLKEFNLHLRNTYDRYIIIIIYENPSFNRLVWGSLRLAPIILMFPAFSAKTHHLLTQRFKYLQTLSYCHCMKSTWRTTLGGVQLLSNFFCGTSYFCGTYLCGTSYLCGTVTVCMHLSTVSKIVNCKI